VRTMHAPALHLRNPRITWLHRTSHTAARQTRRSVPLPATRSASGRTDAPEPMPATCVQSTNPLASPAACACPSRCPHSTNKLCG
jgi:hypothetical protein